MRLLVTRPEPDGQDLARRLAVLGHKAVVEPLLHIEFPITEPLPASGIQAVIATSRNGVRALIGNPTREALIAKPAFAVGEATAKCCRLAGFETVFIGSGTAPSLISLIVAHGAPQAGPLLHLAGETLAADIKGPLEEHGFEVLAPIVYLSIPADRLSESVKLDLGAGRFDGVILMSPRTAQIFKGLIQSEKLTGAIRRLILFCLSEAVAASLSVLGPVETRIAAKPRLEDLIQLIEIEAAQ